MQMGFEIGGAWTFLTIMKFFARVYPNEGDFVFAFLGKIGEME
jgi:hypothetical protein